MFGGGKNRSTQFIGILIKGTKTFTESHAKSDQVIGARIILVFLNKPRLLG